MYDVYDGSSFSYDANDDENDVQYDAKYEHNNWCLHLIYVPYEVDDVYDGNAF